MFIHSLTPTFPYSPTCYLMLYVTLLDPTRTQPKSVIPLLQMGTSRLRPVTGPLLLMESAGGTGGRVTIQSSDPDPSISTTLELCTNLELP